MNALSPSNEDSHRAPTPQCDRYAENERGSCLHNAGGYRQPPCRCRSEEHTSELQSRLHLVCRLLLEKNKDIELSGATASIRRVARATRPSCCSPYPFKRPHSGHVPHSSSDQSTRAPRMHRDMTAYAT